MAKYTQANRPLKLFTKLPEDKLLLEGFEGDEWVSAPFSFTLELLSEDAEIDPKQLLGTPAYLTIELADKKERVIHGVISRFVQLGQREDLTAYRAWLVPWFWLLSLSTDCKIFQDHSVLDIAEAVFKKLQHRDWDVQCKVSDYQKREYCVQYRETHLNFVSRLLQDEGIFYYFEHKKDKDVLTLADPSSPVLACVDDPVRWAAQADAGQIQDVVLAVQRESAVTSDKVTLRDYDYLQPTVELEQSEGSGGLEIYDYPGDFAHPDDGTRRARLLIEAQEAWQHVVRGDSTCRGFQAGRSFELKEHYRDAINGTYRLLHVHHRVSGGGYLSDDAAFHYHNTFLAIPKSVSFRPPRSARKPVMHGSQTALVVGKSGEEIWTDSYGRVKVQFYWDRAGEKNDASSCWVRVASPWAGKNWGAVSLPRIGQEVLVDFLEGDPDRPIISGRVYNADQMPPYTLTANQTQSGIKSRSSKNGGSDNFNELRFEDKKGSEQIVVHAEKDLLTEVENDETRKVGHDRTTTVDNNDTRTVTQGNDALTVKQGDQTVVLEMGNQTITLKQGNQQIELKMGNQETKLALGNLTTTLDVGNVSTKASAGAISDEALQGIELKVAGNSIKIDPTGVTIKGLMVSIEGQVQTEVKGLMTTVNGDGMLTMKGGITMIN